MEETVATTNHMCNMQNGATKGFANSSCHALSQALNNLLELVRSSVPSNFREKYKSILLQFSEGIYSIDMTYM